MATEPTPQQWEQIEAELYSGRKIAAIKHLRESTGCGLAEAKQVIDEHEAKLRQQHPDRFAARKGCMASIVLLAMAGGLAAATAWL